MSFLKNPFGERDGKIIMIEDISPEERGLKCKCVCPSCKDRLMARLGEVRVHHFAHSGEGCDEEIAFLSGLYLIVQDYILNNKTMLPELEIFWEHSRTKFTPENFFDRIHFSRRSENDEMVVVTRATRIKFEKAEIVYNGKRPAGMLLEYQSRKMALCIRPPANVCKTYSVKAYENMATLELDTTGISFSELKKEQITEALGKRFENSLWIYNSKALNAIDEINIANDARIEEMREKEETENRQRQQQWERQRSPFSSGQSAPKVTEEMRDKRLKVGYEEVKELFTQQDTQIRDTYGQRWAKCEVCGEIKPDFEFVSYGGINSVNLGICRDCSRKGSG